MPEHKLTLADLEAVETRLKYQKATRDRVLLKTELSHAVEMKLALVEALRVIEAADSLPFQEPGTLGRLVEQFRANWPGLVNEKGGK